MALALQEAGYADTLVYMAGIYVTDPGPNPEPVRAYFGISEELIAWQAEAIGVRHGHAEEPLEPFTLVMDPDTGHAWMKGERV